MTQRELLSAILGSRVIKACLIVAGAILLIDVLSYLISSTYLARYMQDRMNQRLKGYHVQIGKAYFHPVNLSLDLRYLVVVQEANPDPPVASINRLYLSVHWSALIKARLVGDLLIDTPKLYFNLNNVRAETKSEVPIQKKGWQEAMESVYPLKIDVFRLYNGDITYTDVGPYNPLHASGVYLYATNIRNIRYPDRVYPSPVSIRGVLFDRGKITMDGAANFLMEPYMGVKAAVTIKDMDLGYFRPMTERYNVTLKKGSASADGNMELSPKLTEINLKQLELESVDVDYVHLARTAALEKERAEKVKETAKELSNKPEAKIKVEQLKITKSSFGYINKASNPVYRVFINEVNGTMSNFSNQFAEGPATCQLKGKFMGSGSTTATATFRSEKTGPDFNLNLAIADTQMAPMTDLFRAYGNFDIRQGLFSLYTELTVKNNTINGYVKPLFKDLEVADLRTEKQKNLFHRTYISVVKGVSKLLENRETKKVATEATISGPVDSGKKTSTLQIIINLVRNAFIEAILPGFEREVSAGRKK